jgi:hypothetical protein
MSNRSASTGDSVFAFRRALMQRRVGDVLALDEFAGVVEEPQMPLIGISGFSPVDGVKGRKTSRRTSELERRLGCRESRAPQVTAASFVPRVTT